ncbi:hypothetical protein SISSUDRAFT_1038912 [Sistotremastrum suecicum HHB10207 ss-3]|uniref:Uncharacterized protein n=1 Tax=Sistotremastrum suecicum HHB10207 ss-3 TaxID=1314776 RepID=A0A166J5W2_9AGAM|nr:hypothetical protein SISSUDRAFT_1038912 [Sistotremastrum suecicum HHB10207 ss-3]
MVLQSQFDFTASTLSRPRRSKSQSPSSFTSSSILAKRAHPSQPLGSADGQLNSPSPACALHNSLSSMDCDSEGSTEALHRGKRARVDSSSKGASRRHRPTSQLMRASSPLRPSVSEDWQQSIQSRTPFLNTDHSSPLLPFTSDAFQFSHKSTTSSRNTSPPDTSPSRQRLASLHGDAYVELRRSVAHNEENFITSIREWEEQRHSRGRNPSGRNLNRPHSSYQTNRSCNDSFLRVSPEDEDVDIVIGPASSPTMQSQALWDDELAIGRESFIPALSTVLVDHRSSSPSPVMTGMSTDSSEEDFDFFGSDSYMSDPNPPYTESLQSQSISSPTQAQVSPNAARLTPSASRSDKTLAALSMAMASGAGSVNDYSDILQFEGSVEDHQAGSLWD